ncbi:MAG TPA: M24 family metallopeptidase [Syntrophorhabdales bacterium]|nr:M24 family metallopeptidase [Syntrophorhabdales bacterium]
MAISEKEFERRYKAIRMLMKEAGIDCLVVAGRSDYFSRGNIRYITGLAFGGYAIFPLQGKPVYFLSTNQIASPKHRRAAPVDDIVELKEVRNPLEQIRKEVLRFDGGRKIGIVGMNDIQVPMYLTLKELLGERLVDGGAIFARLRPVKSEEEIEKMRVAASIADRVCTMLRKIVVPGLTDYKIYGSVKKAIYGMRADYSMELIDAEGSTMNMAWGPSGDRLEENGTLFLEITPAFDGYYAQLPVTLPVGAYTPAVRRMKDAWVEAMEAAKGLLRPGERVSDLHRKAQEVIMQNGFVSPLPAGHAIGLDAIDFWRIDESNGTILEAGMTIAFHPCVLAEMGGIGMGMGYTFLINAAGAENLSSLDLTDLG